MKQGISIITVIDRLSNIGELIANYRRQLFREKELIVIIRDDVLQVEEIRKSIPGAKDVRIYQLPEEISLGLCLNFASRKSRYEYIARFCEGYYGPLYLQEIWEVYKRTHCGVIIKREIYCYLKEKRELLMNKMDFIRGFEGGALSFSKECLSHQWFMDEEKNIFTTFYRACLMHHEKIYVSSKNHFLSYSLLVKGTENIDVEKNIELDKAIMIVNKAAIDINEIVDSDRNNINEKTMENSKLTKKYPKVIFLLELTPYHLRKEKHTAEWMRGRLQLFRQNLWDSMQKSKGQNYELYISYAKEVSGVAQNLLKEEGIHDAHIHGGEYQANIEKINRQIKSSQYFCCIRVTESMVLESSLIEKIQNTAFDLEPYRVLDCSLYNLSKNKIEGIYAYIYRVDDFINGYRMDIKKVGAGERKYLLK